MAGPALGVLSPRLSPPTSASITLPSGVCSVTRHNAALLELDAGHTARRITWYGISSPCSMLAFCWSAVITARAGRTILPLPSGPWPVPGSGKRLAATEQRQADGGGRQQRAADVRQQIHQLRSRGCSSWSCSPSGWSGRRRSVVAADGHVVARRRPCSRGCHPPARASVVPTSHPALARSYRRLRRCALRSAPGAPGCVDLGDQRRYSSLDGRDVRDEQLVGDSQHAAAGDRMRALLLEPLPPPPPAPPVDCPVRPLAISSQPWWPVELE